MNMQKYSRTFFERESVGMSILFQPFSRSEFFLHNQRSWNYLVKQMILFLNRHPQNSQLTIFAIRFRVQFYPKKKFLSLNSNMAAPSMNGRLRLTDVHQNSPASLVFFQTCPIEFVFGKCSLSFQFCFNENNSRFCIH